MLPARTASPLGKKSSGLPFVSKCKHCPLLSRPRQRAQHTGKPHTRSSCRKAPGVRGRPRAPSQGGSPRAGRPEPAGCPPGAAEAARERPPPHRPERASVPTRGRGRRGAHGLRTPGACPQRRRQRASAPAPRGRAPGTFPAWSRARDTRSPAEGGGGKHGRRAAPPRGRRRKAKRGRARTRQVRDVLGSRGGTTPEAAGPRRAGFGDGDTGGWPQLEGGGDPGQRWGDARTCKLRGQQRVEEGPGGLRLLSAQPLPPYSGAPRPPSSLHSAPSPERKGKGAATPEGSPSEPAGQGRGDHRPLSSSELSPDFPSPHSLPFAFRKWGKVVMETFPPHHRDYGSWGCLKRFRGPMAGAHTYLWGPVPRRRGATAEAGAGAREAPPPSPLPPHSGTRSAAQHSPCRAPASDWRRWLPPEPERAANEMLMTCAGGGARADQSQYREPNPAPGGLAPSRTPPPGARVRPRARATGGGARGGAYANMFMLHFGFAFFSLPRSKKEVFSGAASVPRLGLRGGGPGWPDTLIGAVDSNRSLGLTSAAPP